MNYTVLSPWAAVDTTQLCGLSPRLDTLAGKTIGMFADLFMVGVHMEEALAGELCRRYPGLKARAFGAMQRLPLPEWGPIEHRRRPLPEEPEA